MVEGKVLKEAKWTNGVEDVGLQRKLVSKSVSPSRGEEWVRTACWEGRDERTASQFQNCPLKSKETSAGQFLTMMRRWKAWTGSVPKQTALRS